MNLDALRQQTFAAALSPTSKGGTATLGFHAGSKTVLAFARALRWLIGAFHFAMVEWMEKVEITLVLSMVVVEALAAADASTTPLPLGEN
jgi:hypothetical protein